MSMCPCELQCHTRILIPDDDRYHSTNVTCSLSTAIVWLLSLPLQLLKLRLNVGTGSLLPALLSCPSAVIQSGSFQELTQNCCAPCIMVRSRYLAFSIWRLEAFSPGSSMMHMADDGAAHIPGQLQGPCQQGACKEGGMTMGAEVT
jgi:hypothetical protein